MHDVFVIKTKNFNEDFLKQIPHTKTVDYTSDRLGLYKNIAMKSVTKHAWILNSDYDYSNFNFDYTPPWHQDSQIHVWPDVSQQHGGDTVLINTAEFLNQVDKLDALQNYQDICWKKETVTQQHKPEIFVWSKSPTSDMIIDDATFMRYTGDPLSMLQKTVRRANTPYIWIVSDELDYSDFDFSWRPSWAIEKYLHVWPTENQQYGGDTFYVNVEEFVKQQHIDSLDQYQTIYWHDKSIQQKTKPEIFVWDKHNNPNIRNQFPNATFLRYIGSKFSMMEKTARHASTPYFWVIDSSCNYDNFDFSWRPSWATDKHLHVWPTENQKKGGDTYFVNTAEFKSQLLEIQSLNQYRVINWHKNNVKLATIPDIVVWSFGNNDENLAKIKKQFPNSKNLRYIGTHLEMVKKSTRYADSNYFWILSDCCDYENFDPNWKPDWETENSIHCWASGQQKFGDTFYVSKLDFLQEVDNLIKLEYYSSIVWHSNGYPRLPWPVNYVSLTDLYTTLKNHKFSTIYEYFVMPGSTLGSTVDPSLWEKRSLIAYNRNGHVSLCPRDCVNGISDRILNYPYIQYHNCEKSTQKPQDIVFISYDEKDADLNYKILKDRFPQAKRVHGVKGNVMAYKEAAKLSDTPWYYAVFPKTKIDPSFNFDIHPNYLETPGHYIFYAHNNVTDNFYGHGSVKMYHVKTTIEIEEWGYDFTLSSPVSIIPINSCFIEPADPYEAWRTSFREVLKLKNDVTVESRYRLHRWLTIGNGKFGEYSQAGAVAALEYNGDTKIANDWEWLREQFNSRYS